MLKYTIGLLLSFLLIALPVMAQSSIDPTAEPTAEATFLPTVEPTAEATPRPDDPPGDIVPPKYVPIDELPVCDETFDEIKAENQVPPNFNAPITCRLKGQEIKGEDAVNPWAFTSIPGQGDEKGRAANVLPTKSFADFILDCHTTCGNGQPNIESFYMVLSAKPPRLAAGNSGWNNYSFANRFHYGDTTGIACYIGGNLISTTRNVSLGLQYGSHLTGYTDDGWMHIFWERFFTADCAQTVSATRINPNAAIYSNIYTVTDSNNQQHWIGRMWLNGTWTQMFDVLSLAKANALDAGLELTAINQDKNRILIPVNFQHKSYLQFNGNTYSWHDYVLPSQLYNKTTMVTESPWNVMDIIGGNYTSIAADANLNGGN